MRGLDPAFWAGRNVFVTGHTGFKGGWLCLMLRRFGARVTGFSLPAPTNPSLFETAGVAGAVTSVIGDIRDAGALRRAMAEAAPDVVFHLAAQPLVRRAHADPVETLSTNVMGTVNLLEAVRAAPSVRALVVVTSDKVYDNQEWPWAYRETDRLGGKEPYGVSKACCELIADSYRYSYFAARSPGLAMATVRAGNIIGGGDWAEDRLIPDAIRAFADAAPLVVRNPAAVRPWQHVLEPVAGYSLLAQALVARPQQAGRAWNFGPAPEDAWPVSRVVDRLVGLWGDGARWQLANGAQPYEARLLSVDSSQSVAELGWRPAWRLDTALERTVEWYRDFVRGGDMAAATARQIEEYLNG